MKVKIEVYVQYKLNKSNVLHYSQSKESQYAMSSQNGYKKRYTAYIAQEDGWWVGWVQGVRGVNCQEKTRKELLDALRVTLPEILEYDRKRYNQVGFVRTPEPHFEPVTFRT